MKNKRGLSGVVWVLLVLIIIAIGVGIYFFFIYNPNPDCYDLDGGKNYYKSTICYDNTNYPLPGGGTDNCYTEGDKEYLSEMYCQNNGCQRVDKHLCPNGCRDGACIK